MSTASPPAEQVLAKLGQQTKRQQQGERSRESILDATERLMATSGFAATSISDIPKACGLPASSIYWHFGSKDGVLAAVMERGSERAPLSLMAEVRDLARRLADGSTPDVVECNAAVIADLDDRTSEGLQRTFATNHLAPYLLLRSLVASFGERSARFVVVGGRPRSTRRAPVDFDDLQCRGGRGLGPLPSFRPFVAYGRTKNMNAMTIYALARRPEATGITVNGVHPGHHQADRPRPRDGARALKLFAAVLEARASSGPEVGADCPIWLSTSEEVEGMTGRFFVARRQTGAALHTTDVARCDRLWEESARLVGLDATP